MSQTTGFREPSFPRSVRRMSRSSSSSLVVLVVFVVACGSKKEANPTAPAPTAAVKEPPAAAAPKPEPTPTPTEPTTPARKSIEATTDGVAGLSAATPITFAELKQLTGAKVTGPFPEKRGGLKASFVNVELGDQSVDVFFLGKPDRLAWFQISSYAPEQTTCVEGACLGDPLARAKALAGATCKANHDGQGFSASFDCGKPGSSLVVLGALPDDLRQDHQLGQKTEEFPIDELIAAKGVVGGFAWVASGATWAPGRYDEGDR